MDDRAAKRAAESRRRGRTRLLSTEQVLDAALELGLDWPGVCNRSHGHMDRSDGKSGVEPTSALMLQRLMGEIVLGGALTEMRNQSLHDVGKHLSSALAARGTDEGNEGLKIYAETAQDPV